MKNRAAEGCARWAKEGRGVVDTGCVRVAVAPVGIFSREKADTSVQEGGAEMPEESRKAAGREEVVDVDCDFDLWVLGGRRGWAGAFVV